MGVLSHIEHKGLPKVCDFKVLQDEALAYIQSLGGSAWTNLNPSDPGVTILNQLCFALTELGYCSHFPVKDILSNPNDTVQIKDQFFVPDAILTTAPITIDDYIKLVLDRIPAVLNITIDAFASTNELVDNVYRSFVWLGEGITIEVQKEQCLAIYFLLNSYRNLGAYFLLPEVFKPVSFQVNGILEIESGYSLDTVLADISKKINNYIFPTPLQTGYDQLTEEGYSINEIYNGPKLEKGWIPTESIQPKKQEIQAFNIVAEIQSVTGVKSIQKLSFGNDETNIIGCLENEIIVLEVFKTLEEGAHVSLQINSQEALEIQAIQKDIILEVSKIANVSIQNNTVEAICLAPDLPQGNFRDISSYYSIQNTFPKAYAVGENDITSNATDYQIAQSRQLKGYLTIFDQVVTNQFAQLANLKSLFSFKNSITGDPEDFNYFHVTKSEYEKYHKSYPVPYLSFSPTYFYQSLYTQVPNVKPLLKNSNTFNYNYQPLPSTELNTASWQAYKEDPYNSYIHGLFEIMEKDEVNIVRRNDMLDHLLARHGVSPETMNTIITTTAYTSVLAKDVVIIKSLFLQNFEQLSYHRSKAYNFLGAQSLQNILTDEIPILYPEMQEIYLQQAQEDFVFQMHHVDQREALHAQDFINYSTIQLKISLLLALNTRYQNYLATQQIALSSTLAIWMLKQQKGVLCIEANLLLQSALFNPILKVLNVDEPTLYYTTVNSIDYEQFTLLLIYLEFNQLTINEQGNIADTSISGVLSRIVFDIEETSAVNDLSFVEITGSCTLYNTTAIWEGVSSDSIQISDIKDTSIFILPEFIDDFKNSTFRNSLNYLLENELPIEQNPIVYYAEESVLKSIIEAFSNWHNELIYKSLNSSASPEESFEDILINKALTLNVTAGNLLTQLITANVFKL